MNENTRLKMPIRAVLQDILCNVPVTEDQYDSLEEYVRDMILHLGHIQYNDGYLAGMQSLQESNTDRTAT